VHLRRFLWPFLLLGTACFGPHGHYHTETRQVCLGDVCYYHGELPGWNLVRHKGGEVAFFNPPSHAVAQANVTCRDDAEAASLEVLTRHLLIGYTELHQRSQERTWLNAREALHTVLDARLDGVPMVLDLYVVKRNGCIYDLSLAAPPDRYAEVVPDFSRFVAGFAQESRS
jgi:hypothetical protein